MMQQQTPVYPNMMNNQQQNVYNSAGNNPVMNRTPSQTPMSIQNQPWSNNSAMSVNRQPTNAYNQVEVLLKSIIQICFCHAHLDDGTRCSTTTTTATTTTTLCCPTATALSIKIF